MHYWRTISFLLISSILISSCKVSPSEKSGLSSSANGMLVDGKLYAALFQQKAAEYDALCFQAYQLAQWRLKEILNAEAVTRPAIITDVDETVLDNSPYAVQQAKKGLGYDRESWKKWTALAEADTLAGALGFFKFAEQSGVEIFYITNRSEEEREGTLQNLRKFDFPFSDSEHLLLQSTTSDKEERRNQVLKEYNVLLLLGDNLSDFDQVFYHASVEKRNEQTQKLAQQFGDRFILFPNTGYGDWESALFQYHYDLSDEKKKELIINSLTGY